MNILYLQERSKLYETTEGKEAKPADFAFYGDDIYFPSPNLACQ